MDYLGEAIALAIDALILGVCLKQYFKNKNAIAMIQGAPYLEIDKDLMEIVNTHPDRKLTYVSIRGSIKAIGNPIVSTNNAKVTGVIQLLSIKEHMVQRGTAGFWSNHERTIQEVQNVMPFTLQANGQSVEVVDPLAADILDTDVISDVFRPTVPNVMDHIWGFFAGIKQRGIQTTEKMLRENTMIIGIGELVSTDDGKYLRLQPPANGAPYYLTGMEVTSLVRKLDGSQRSYRIVCVIFGAVGLVISGLMIGRYYKYWSRKHQDAKRQLELEHTRRERRRRVRENVAVERTLQKCVVCSSNPQEIILLPCGHVCLCEDCVEEINEFCPVCRAVIEMKHAAYIA